MNKSMKSRKKGGRSKGARNIKSVLKEVAFEEISVRENGISTKRALLDLVIRSLRHHAVEKTNFQAIKVMLELIEKYDLELSRPQGGWLMVSEVLSPEEWIAETSKLYESRKPSEAYVDSERQEKRPGVSNLKD